MYPPHCTLTLLGTQLRNARHMPKNEGSRDNPSTSLPWSYTPHRGKGELYRIYPLGFRTEKWLKLEFMNLFDGGRRGCKRAVNKGYTGLCHLHCLTPRHALLGAWTFFQHFAPLCQRSKGVWPAIAHSKCDLVRRSLINIAHLLASVPKENLGFLLVTLYWCQGQLRNLPYIVIHLRVRCWHQ